MTISSAKDAEGKNFLMPTDGNGSASDLSVCSGDTLTLTYILMYVYRNGLTVMLDLDMQKNASRRTLILFGIVVALGAMAQYVLLELVH